MKTYLIKQTDQDNYLDGMDGERIYINTTASWQLQQKGWLRTLYVVAVNQCTQTLHNQQQRRLSAMASTPPTNPRGSHSIMRPGPTEIHTQHGRTPSYQFYQAIISALKNGGHSVPGTLENFSHLNVTVCPRTFY